MARKIKIVHSPTKPGTDYVQVDADTIARLQEYSNSISKNLIDLKNAMDKWTAEEGVVFNQPKIPSHIQEMLDNRDQDEDQ